MGGNPNGSVALVQNRVDAQGRRQQVLELRLGGGSFRAIAERLNVALGTVHKDYKTALAALVDKETADQARTMQTERYHRLLLSWWRQATGYTEKGVTYPPDSEATRLCLNIIQQIRAIHGLDAPVKTQLTGEDGGPVRLTIEVVDQETKEALADLLAKGE